jgi:lipopolysaccharide/colanic/teichoic acid biosynthesis glycosyltransferase
MAPGAAIAPYFRWKSVVDRLVAGLLLVPGIPVILLLMLVVRVTSRGKAIYAQLRVGRNGHTFTMYKIRTMAANAESRTGAVWAVPGDPRVTRLGRILRKLHLDEFPQLFNVLRGDMSLIGPRPERPEFVELLSRNIPGYRDRLLVLPGITGLAQINLPPDTDLDSVRRKLVLDVEYIQTASLFLDARMFLCTLVRLCGLPGSPSMCLFGLQREVEDPAATAPPPADNDFGAVSGNGRHATNGTGQGNGHPVHAAANGHPSHRAAVGHHKPR